MWKLRTMWDAGPAAGAERGWVQYIIADPPPTPKARRDRRVRSRFARLCRQHSIDEIPQFWNVMRGEMAIVGPRPVTPEEMKREYGRYADELLQHRPGLTGLWQVSGRSAIPFPERANLDLELVRTLSFRLYCRILWHTIPALLGGIGAW
jgi:lipopolysaccharide/colanic/teichoic acid biosynthesis glycosyltransferase